MKRKPTPSGLRMKVIRKANYKCFYCNDRATEVDHILPWAWVEKHEEQNLVACCKECNLIAGDKVFDTFAEKITYIQRKRRKRDLKKTPKNDRKPVKIPVVTNSNGTSKPRKSEKSIPTRIPGSRLIEGTSVNLLKMHDDLSSWDKVGKYYGVHRIVVWRIANDGYEPKSEETRRKLGLPEIIQRRAYRDKSGRFAKPPTGE